jgi:hypothetical protein
MANTETRASPGQKAGEILQNLVNVHYARAGFWSNVLLGMQLLLYLAGVAAVFVPKLTTSYPPVALALVIIGTWLSFQASKFKGAAEVLKRHYEHWQGFGKDLPRALLADMRATTFGGISAEEDRLLREGLSFSSLKPLGLKQAHWGPKLGAGRFFAER